MTFWYNGELVQSQTLELAIDNPGLLYGATVFTTLRVYENSLDSSLTNWRLHCDRLKFSLDAFGWQQPDWCRLDEGAQVMISYFPILRITVFPDGREWIIGRFLPKDLTERQIHGIEARLSTKEFARCLPTHKTGNYLSAWLAKGTAQEAILVDAEGNWLETTTSNLWGWEDGNWWTPPLNAGILPGIVRNQLVNWLGKKQLVKEEPWTPQLVKRFEAIAISNSVIEIIPIHTVYHQTQQLEYLKYDPHHSSFQQLRRFFAINDLHFYHESNSI